jgi:putative metalloprotease
MTSHAQSDLFRLIRGVIKAGQALTIGDEELANIVKSSIDAMDRSNNVCSENSAYTKRLRRITNNFRDADGIRLNFKVYNTTEINAFACPDGSIRIFSALMDLLNDDELLGVIGHEIGHVALRHSKKAWREELLRGATSDAIGAFSDTWASLSDSFIGNIAGAAISAKHSRNQENEADEYGYEYLKRCGKNPWAMGKAFIKMKKLDEEGDSRYRLLLQPFSSHPDFEERIGNIRKMAESDGYPCL